MMRRLLVVSFSLANLCYLRIWGEMLILRPQDAFYQRNPPGPSQYLAAICGVTILAALVVLCCLVLRKAHPWMKSAWFIALTLISANAIRALLAPYFPVLRSGLFRFVSPQVAFWLAMVAFGGGCYLVFRFPVLVGSAGAFIATLFAPFMFVTFGESVLQILRFNSKGAQDKPFAPRLPTNPRQRVVWVIFDELDYHFSFVARPELIQMPNFDRLCSHGLCASNAIPPSDATTVSMPALIYGQNVRSTRALSAERFLLELADGSSPFFGDPPNVFSRARASGFNTAVVGWYLPYCRTLNESLSDCWWYPMENLGNSSGHTFAEALLRQPRSLLETPLFSPFGQSMVTRAHAAVFEELLVRAKKMASDPALGLVLVHFNIPHAPYFYSRATGKFDRANSLGGYTDALALVDRTFGELQVAMEAAGTWAHSSVLISADHWFRSSPEVKGKRDLRVPFLLHLAGADDAMSFHGEFETVLSADLILNILHGEIRTHRQAADWIAKNASGSVSAHVRTLQ
jgi:hypothetical protein